jgi:hypothetical protein
MIDNEFYLKFVQVFLKLLFVVLIQMKVLENQKIYFSHENDDDDDDDDALSFYNQLYIHEFHMDEI